MFSSWTFHIVTLGCKINQYESQSIREAWQKIGGKEVDIEESPEVFLVNSCAITARGERDTRNALYRLQKVQEKVKNTKPCLRILSGCAAHLVEKTLQQAPQKNSHTTTSSRNENLSRKHYDLLVPPKAKALLLQGPKALQAFLCPEKALSMPEYINPFGEEAFSGFSISRFHRVRPVLKIQDGCSHRCTYCIVPLVRGKSISRPPMAIVEEAQRLFEAGHREIMLSGINLHHYGRDLGSINGKQWDFWDIVLLLEKILAPDWKGKARLRISSLEPSQLNIKGVEALTTSSLLCPHLHLSLQHGSPQVLKKMGRGHYALAQLKHTIKNLREHWKRMGLGADILMGFAGESEDDVLQTLDFIEEIGLTYAHVFPYSIRPGTAAANFSQQIPHALKLERAARVRSLVEKQKKTFVQSLLQEESLHVVFDAQGDSEETCSHNALIKGVDAHYVSCQLLPCVHLANPDSLQTPQGIVAVKPVQMQDETLLCRV